MCVRGTVSRGKGGENPINETIIVELVLLMKQFIPRQSLSCHTFGSFVHFLPFFDLIATTILHFPVFHCHSRAKLMISEARSVENCKSLKV